jgi:hypothetical protein
MPPSNISQRQKFGKATAGYNPNSFKKTTKTKKASFDPFPAATVRSGI